jgi:hypothetical protein
MQVTLSRGPGGVYYELTAEDGRSQIFQTDWDYPGLASNFGYVPCECRATDGTVDCPHKSATEMIGAAAEFLDELDGATCEDPGYFSAA